MTRLSRDPPRGVHPANPPRAGRQQGYAGSDGCAGGPFPSKGVTSWRGWSHGRSSFGSGTAGNGADLPGDCFRGRGPGRPRAVPQVPAGHVRRAQGPGAGHRTAPAGAAQRADQSRLSLQRAPRLREDIQRAHPGPLAELREGADAGPLRRVRLVRRPRAVRAGQHRRDRDRRGVPRRGRRRARPSRAGLLRAGRRAVQGLHHRRGAHGDPAGVQRPAQAGRGATAAPEVHLRDHRAGEGHPRPSGPGRTTTRSGWCRPPSCASFWKTSSSARASPSIPTFCRWWCAREPAGPGLAVGARPAGRGLG